MSEDLLPKEAEAPDRRLGFTQLSPQCRLAADVSQATALHSSRLASLSYQATAFPLQHHSAVHAGDLLLPKFSFPIAPILAEAAARGVQARPRAWTRSRY